MHNIAITGMGIVSSLGTDVRTFFARIRAGDVAIDVKISPNMPAAQIAMRWGLHGPQ